MSAPDVVSPTIVLESVLVMVESVVVLSAADVVPPTVVVVLVLVVVESVV